MTMRKWTCITGVIIIIGLLAGRVSTQTVDCHHLTNDVAYWDNLRVALGNVTEIHGSDITLVAKGKDQVAVKVLHVTDNTEYTIRKENTIHKVTSQVLRDNQGGLWCVSYCYWCREVFSISKMEGL
jgi:hypothetical protein